MTASMPVDYFKISYDEDSILAALSDSQEESSGAAPWVLRGWSQIQDESAFLEILNRVRVGHGIGQYSLDDTLGYIAGVYDLTQKLTSASDDDDDDERKRLSELAQSKDSGFDQQEIGDCEKLDESLLAFRILPKSSFSSPDIGDACFRIFARHFF